ncbi:hypothetical protein BS330_12990 [Amycolatopsis keratiniphila subsp. nogabecina]|nr:hypothetical protein BS330_12990 [Amycolatopsis keratiniphila subsp. nogabecina]
MPVVGEDGLGVAEDLDVTVQGVDEPDVGFLGRGEDEVLRTPADGTGREQVVHGVSVVIAGFAQFVACATEMGIRGCDKPSLCFYVWHNIGCHQAFEEGREAPS